MGPSFSCKLPRRFIRHGTVTQLAAFEAVMRLGSVTGAADDLCIAQPTLSGHLRKLREALGVQLFEMDGKRMVPTEAATVLLGSTLEVFAALVRCDQQLQTLRAPQPVRTHPAAASERAAWRAAA